MAKARLWRVVGGLAGLVLVLVLAGTICQAIAALGDQRAHPPPGQLVDVNGDLMQIDCKGEGSPTVELEAGR